MPFDSVDRDVNNRYDRLRMPSTKALETKLTRVAAKADSSREERDDAMRALRSAGVSLRRISELAGISHTAVANITRSAAVLHDAVPQAGL